MTVIRSTEVMTGQIELTKLYHLNDEQYAEYQQLESNAERDEFLLYLDPFDSSSDIVDLSDTVSLDFQEEE